MSSVFFNHLRLSLLINVWNLNKRKFRRYAISFYEDIDATNNCLLANGSAFRHCVPNEGYILQAGSQYTAFNVPDEFVQLTENRPATLEEFKSSSEYLPFMINNLGYACCRYFFDTGQFWCSIARYGSYTNNLFYLFAACFWCTEIYARCPGIQRSGI